MVSPRRFAALLNSDQECDGPATAGGWRSWHEAGQGDSYHITSLRNANVTFQFFGSFVASFFTWHIKCFADRCNCLGTGIAFYGLTNSSFNIIIDDGPRVPVNASLSSDGLLFSSSDLSNKLHNSKPTLPSLTLSIFSL